MSASDGLKTSLRTCLLICLTACGNELSVGAGATRVEAGPSVSVRTRPVCGNGTTETGEACDDGANGDDSDGCDDRCQAPCGADDLEIVRCGVGRAFHEVREGVDYYTKVPFHRDSVINTAECEVVGGERVELRICTDGVCLNIFPPASGERICAAPCHGDGTCGNGFTCVATVAAGSQPPRQDTARCIPAIGGRVGDQCASQLDCGAGLTCSQVVGFNGYATCSGSISDCERDTCDRGFICGASEDSDSHAPTGDACFPFAEICPGEPLGVVDFDAACNAGCDKLAECGLVYTDPKDNTREVDCRSYCLEQGGPVALTLACALRIGCDAFELPADVDDFVSAPPRTFAPAECPADVDATCTFGADCDPDCQRATGCGDTPAAGRCDERGVVYCEQNRVVSINCVERDLRCGYDAEQARFDCIRGAQ